MEAVFHQGSAGIPVTTLSNPLHESFTEPPEVDPLTKPGVHRAANAGR